MNSKTLEEIGLTSGETRVYLALVSLGATKTGPLAKKAEVSSSKVYKILDRLIRKGLVGHVLKGKIKYFQALEPRRLLDYLSQKEKELKQKRCSIEKILPQLELQKKIGEQKTEAIIYDGFRAVTNFFLNMVDELNPGETYYVIGGGYGETPALRSFFQQHHQRRAKKKIKVKMLANHNERITLVKTTYLCSEIKFLPEYLITNMEIVFYKNKSFIILWTKSPLGFLIINEEAAKSFKKYFNTFWKIAK